MSTGITRRAVLAGAVALPWLAACGRASDTVADPEAERSRPGTRTPASRGPHGSAGPGTRAPAGVELENGTFSSRFWPGQRVHWRLARPIHHDSGTRSPPLVVALHGHGGNAGWAFTEAHLERYVRQTGLAVASVDGGDFYWHARRSGVDTGRLVSQGLLPLLDRKGLSTDRIALIGWSMGGYGALLLASRLGRERVAAVVAVSAALWESADESSRDAFDGRPDFARNDVFRARRALTGIPLRLDCGRDDRFIGANRALARELPSAATTFDDGGHNKRYWMSHAGAEMRWLSRHF